MPFSMVLPMKRDMPKRGREEEKGGCRVYKDMGSWTDQQCMECCGLNKTELMILHQKLNWSFPNYGLLAVLELLKAGHSWGTISAVHGYPRSTIEHQVLTVLDVSDWSIDPIPFDFTWWSARFEFVDETKGYQKAFISKALRFLMWCFKALHDVPKNPQIGFPSSTAFDLNPE